MQIYKKFIIFLAFVSACICLFIISDTYAKYRTSVKQITNIPIARWNVEVNGTSIKNNETLTNVIAPVFPGNEHIASGIIAPTAEGYFDLVLDYSEIDVSFSYSISATPNSESTVKDIIITGYSVDDAIDTNTITPFDPAVGITDIIALNQSTNNIVNNTVVDNTANSQNTNTTVDNVVDTSRTVRIYIKWDDNSETATMDNAADTAATKNESNIALLDVNLSFIQVAQ